MNETPTGETSEVARRSGYSPEGTPTQRVDGPPPLPTAQPGQPEYGYGQPAQQPYHYPQPQYGSAPQPTAQTPTSQPAPRRSWGAPIAGPVLLIAAGVLFLLNSLEIVPWTIWLDLWRLWPLALIAIGLDILFGRRRPLVSLLIVALVFVVGGALVLYLGVGTRGDLTTYNLNLPAANARSATVEIDSGLGELRIDAGERSGALASGALEYYSGRSAPEADVSMDGDRAVATIRTGRDNGWSTTWFGSGQGPRWTIHLNPQLPTTLRIDLGAGTSDIDLTGASLAGLDVNSGAGNTTVTFPRPKGRVSAKIDGGVGNLVLRVPEGVEAQVNVDTGVGSVNIDSRFSKKDAMYVTPGYAAAADALTIEVDGGVGNIEVKK